MDKHVKDPNDTMSFSAAIDKGLKEGQEIGNKKIPVVDAPVKAPVKAKPFKSATKKAAPVKQTVEEDKVLVPAHPSYTLTLIDGAPTITFVNWEAFSPAKLERLNFQVRRAWKRERAKVIQQQNKEHRKNNPLPKRGIKYSQELEKAQKAKELKNDESK